MFSFMRFLYVFLIFKIFRKTSSSNIIGAFINSYSIHVGYGLEPKLSTIDQFSNEEELEEEADETAISYRNKSLLSLKF